MLTNTCVACSVSPGGAGPITSAAACRRLAGSGRTPAIIGAITLSKDGSGWAAPRLSGTLQRSNSRSKTDSEPKKKHDISTKPSTRPSQVCR
jgi:hypothetical protein